MHTTLQIPIPCNQDWNAMEPNKLGKHCLQCCKTVVDFTTKEPDEIVEYLKANIKQSICGRFKATHLNTPIYNNEEIAFDILNSSLSFFKKIAAVILIVFGIVVTGCNTHSTNNITLKTNTVIDTPKNMVPLQQTDFIGKVIQINDSNNSNIPTALPAKKNKKPTHTTPISCDKAAIIVCYSPKTVQVVKI